MKLHEKEDQQKKTYAKMYMKEQNTNAFGVVGCSRYVIETKRWGISSSEHVWMFSLNLLKMRWFPLIFVLCCVRSFLCRTTNKLHVNGLDGAATIEPDAMCITRMRYLICACRTPSSKKQEENRSTNQFHHNKENNDFPRAFSYQN